MDSIFPRKTGRCYTHTIPKNVVNGNHENWEEVFDEQNLTIALNYLKQNKANLVKGDLICFLCISGYRNDGIAIYDGKNIIQLDYNIDDYGGLPKQFQVVANNVPISYWHQYDEYDEQNNVRHYIAHNSLVWLDISRTLPNHYGMNIRDVCISSIYHEQIDAKYCIYAMFGKYKIIYDTEESIDVNTDPIIIQNLRKEFTNVLINSDDLLQLDSCSIFDNFECNEYTMFLSKYEL